MIKEITPAPFCMIFVAALYLLLDIPLTCTTYLWPLVPFVTLWEEKLPQSYRRIPHDRQKLAASVQELVPAKHDGSQRRVPKIEGVIFGMDNKYRGGGLLAKGGEKKID